MPHAPLLPPSNSLMPATATGVAVRRFSMIACGPHIGYRGPGGLRVLCDADLWLPAVRAPTSPPLVLTRSVVEAHRSALPAHCARPIAVRAVDFGDEPFAAGWPCSTPPRCPPRPPLPSMPTAVVLGGSQCPPVAPPLPAWSAVAAHRPPPPSGCSQMAGCGVWKYKIPRIPASFLLVKAAVLAQVTPPPAKSHLASLPLPPSAVLPSRFFGHFQAI